MLNQQFKCNEKKYSVFVDQDNPFNQSSLGMQQTIPENHIHPQYNIPDIHRHPQYNIPENHIHPQYNTSEIHSDNDEPIREESTIYEADNSNENFLCNNIKCNHLNDVLFIVCIVIGMFLSWIFVVTFICPRSLKHNNYTNFTI